RVVVSTTISLVKSTSGILSVSFQSFHSFSRALALVTTAGASLARFSSSTEPDHSLVGFTGFLSARAAGAARASTATVTTPRVNHCRSMILRSFRTGKRDGPAAIRYGPGLLTTPARDALDPFYTPEGAGVNWPSGQASRPHAASTAASKLPE